MHTIPKEEAGVYDMLCRADSIGVFQVESRAQIGTLPRLKPRRFYDLVIEIALIRPGPIQGGAVHPYIRRATGREPVTYLHPALEPVLKRTHGVPLFQEQLMQIAMAVGGCTGDDADLLRRAMGSKRGIEQIERLRDTLYDGMAGHGITGDLADDIYDRIQAFANFGFAESHAISFGLIVYAISWLKLHYPGAFLAGLLRAQPMGFYSPQSLVADARRHGVRSCGPTSWPPVSTPTSKGDPTDPPDSTAALTAISHRSRRSSRTAPDRTARRIAATARSRYGSGSPRCRASATDRRNGSLTRGDEGRSPTCPTSCDVPAWRWPRWRRWPRRGRSTASDLSAARRCGTPATPTAPRPWPARRWTRRHRCCRG